MKSLLVITLLWLISAPAEESRTNRYWMKIKAKNSQQRSLIANTGTVIEAVADDYVIADGNIDELNAVKATGMLVQSFVKPQGKLDFPDYDANFHNYNELMEAMKAIRDQAPEVVAFEVIGQSVEGRDIINLRISTNLEQSHEKPAILFLGTHHAREHLSTEVPLKLAKYLIDQYKAGNEEVRKLINSREINIVPLVNPDGSEYDIADGSYEAWRKNRGQRGTFVGVDLNRNYSFGWGGPGSSGYSYSDTYRGPTAFSEPETQAVKAFVERKTNINILLSFHTFSQLILYPWGHKNESIENEQDRLVHETMAKKMAEWNKYTPKKSSELYVASGDTTDWSYGTQKIISFTFELDPKWAFGTDGFYPGQDAIQRTFEKNIMPCLYLIEHSDNPYRVLK